MNKETNIYSFADECYVFYGDYKKDIEERDKEIERLNNIIKDLIKDIEIIVECEDIDIIKMQLRTCLYNKLKELKENK